MNEPVAWRWRRHGSFDWKVTCLPPDQWDAPNVPLDWEPLYAAAPSPAPVPVDPAELAALRRDAARYRWLRDSSNDYANDIVPVILVSDEKTGDDMLAEEKLDAAIDAALAANGEKL